MSVAIIQPRLLLPTRVGAELFWDVLDRKDRAVVDKLFGSLPDIRDFVRRTGSDANYLSKKFGDLIFGATAFTAPVTLFAGLWTAALDDTFTGATTSEAAYTSYGRLSLTNNTTIFAAGSGTTTYTKTFPSDALKSWPASTGSTATVTYMGVLDGNAGTTADHGIVWCSVTSTTINSGDTPQLAQNAVSQVRD